MPGPRFAIAMFMVLMGVIGETRTFADGVLNNPYVILYARRVEIAKIDVDKQKSIAEFEAARYDRAQRLFDRNAMSLEELQNIKSKAEVAALMVSDYQLRVSEAEAMLEIARVRISAGLEMPICQRGGE